MQNTKAPGTASVVCRRLDRLKDGLGVWARVMYPRARACVDLVNTQTEGPCWRITSAVNATIEGELAGSLREISTRYGMLLFDVAALLSTGPTAKHECPIQQFSHAGTKIEMCSASFGFVGGCSQFNYNSVPHFHAWFNGQQLVNNAGSHKFSMFEDAVDAVVLAAIAEEAFAEV